MTLTSLESFDADLAQKGIRRMDLTNVMENWDTLFKFLETKRSDVMFHFDITNRNVEMFEKFAEVAAFTSGQHKTFMKCGKCIIYMDHFVVGFKRQDGGLKSVFLRILREYGF